MKIQLNYNNNISIAELESYGCDYLGEAIRRGQDHDFDLTDIIGTGELDEYEFDLADIDSLKVSFH